MIHMSEEVVSAPASEPKRRSATASGGRNTRRTENAAKTCLAIKRVFSDPEHEPFSQIEWERRTAEITDDAGKDLFKQETVEVPTSWSLLATKVVVSKYFYGEQGTAERDLRAATHSSHLSDDRGLGREGWLFQQGRW